MAFETELALISRFALIFVYLYIFVFFLKNYVKSKKSGFKNDFFLGYAIFFGALFFFQIGLSSIEFLDRYVYPGVLNAMKGDFDTKPVGFELPIFDNLLTPIFVVGLIMMMVLLIGQINPVEKIINWKKKPITIYLIIVMVMLILVFVPILTFTLFSTVAFFLCIIGMALGLLLNVGVNIRLAHVSTGDLKKRSIMIIFGTIFFYLGFLWTLEIQEISLGQLFPVWSTKLDVVVGSITQGLAGFFFRLGLKPTTT